MVRDNELARISGTSPQCASSFRPWRRRRLLLSDAFQLPDDYLRAIQVGRVALRMESGVWGMLGPLGISPRQRLQDRRSDYRHQLAAPLNLRYIRRVTDPNLFDAGFVNASRLPVGDGAWPKT